MIHWVSLPLAQGNVGDGREVFLLISTLDAFSVDCTHQETKESYCQLLLHFSTLRLKTKVTQVVKMPLQKPDMILCR